MALNKRQKTILAATQPGKLYSIDDALKILKDNSKAKFVLAWRPAFDLKKMADSAWEYRRAADDPRVVWYPG